jgi:hypothetical protein
MSLIANNAIVSLLNQLDHDMKEISDIDKEMLQLEAGYLRYKYLSKVREHISEQALKKSSLIGKFMPPASSQLAAALLPRAVSLKKIRNSLKLWEKLEFFLSGRDGKETISGFRSFLMQVDQESPTPQAIDSAIKAHRELFEDLNEGGERVVRLKNPHASRGKFDRLLALRGSSGFIYGNPDEYVRQQREG